MDLEETIFNALQNVSPLVLVGIVLILVLAALKKIPWYPNWSIPLTSLFLGTISYCLLADWTPRNIILGLIIGGFPVGIHQTFKQIFIQKDCVKKGDTEWFTKKDCIKTKLKKKKKNPIIYN